MADPQGVIPDDAYWQRLAQEKGPGFAQSARTAYEASQPAGPVDAPAGTVPPATGLVPPPAPPDALRPPPADIGAAQPPSPTTTPTVAQTEPSFTPPGPQTVQTTDQHTSFTAGAKIDPALEAAKDTILGQTLETNKEAAGIREAEARQEAELQRQKAAELEAKRAENEKRIEDQRLAEAKQAQAIADAQKEHDALPGVQEGVGTKVVNALALALSGFGKALGGQSKVEEVIENERTQRINAWKAQYERSKGKVAGAQNLYATLRQKGLDDTAATLAATHSINEKFANALGVLQAESKAPLTIAEAERERQALLKSNIEGKQKLAELASPKITTTTDKKTVTKEGGTSEDKLKWLKAADDDPYIKQYRTAATALNRFDSLIKAGADGTALADYIAGEGGLKQGSFSPNFVEMMNKKGLWGKTVEQVRSKLQGGADPDLIKSIRNGLAAQQGTALTQGARRFKIFEEEFGRVGLDPKAVRAGETSADAAALAGATPSTYQGKQ